VMSRGRSIPERARGSTACIRIQREYVFNRLCPRSSGAYDSRNEEIERLRLQASFVEPRPLTPSVGGAFLFPS
jgi:hypothetical protein